MGSPLPCFLEVNFSCNASMHSGVASYGGWPDLASRLAQRVFKSVFFAPVGM